MKKRRYICLAILAVGLLASAALFLRPRQLPLEECSQICRDFADNPHVSVAFIKDLPVNDTLAVDVTTLQALDSIGWYRMMLYFGYSDEMIEDCEKTIKQLKDDNTNQFVRFYADKDDCSKRIPPNHVNCRCVIGSYKDRTFSIYHTGNTEIQDIITRNELRKLKE